MPFKLTSELEFFQAITLQLFQVGQVPPLPMPVGTRDLTNRHATHLCNMQLRGSRPKTLHSLVVCVTTPNLVAQVKPFTHK